MMLMMMMVEGIGYRGGLPGSRSPAESVVQPSGRSCCLLLRTPGVGFGVQGLGCRVWDSGFRVLG